LLEGLNQSVEQDPIKASVAKADTVLVMPKNASMGFPAWWIRPSLPMGGVSGSTDDAAIASVRVYFSRRMAVARGKLTEQDTKGAALG
jgi:hypothetical protein